MSNVKSNQSPQKKGKNLVIVESPAKARTIERYLGRDFTVMASVGHVRDLPKNELGVEIEDNFTPKYKTIKGKKKIIDALKSAAKEADKIYLATDPDREGEAIAWHIATALKTKADNTYRVQFNEITKQGVNEGIKEPGRINMNRVNAQQSRRILDRLVGYKVSPLLWKPLKYGLSAGRVQSVALRLICEREEEIEKFVPKEYWTLDGYFEKSAGAPESKGEAVKARLEKKNGKKIEIPDEKKVREILSDLENKEAKVTDVAKKELRQSPAAPFITSTLQQDANRKLGFTAKKTMMLAQQLYEGISLGNEGPVGLITYMRTDSTRVSSESVKQAKTFITKHFGEKFLGKGRSAKSQKKKAGTQDAHEAIRPTNVDKSPDNIKNFLTNDQYKLYKLIWDRFVASQMAPALFDQSTITITVGDYEFITKGKILKFPGFMKLYVESKENGENNEDSIIYDVTKDEKLEVKNYEEKQHFTSPPPRYSEARLVKTLEQKGIGRPSTYASIISTIIERNYVLLEEKKFRPTELGRIVNKLLISNFTNLFNAEFTAEMEKELDQVESGSKEWVELLNEFYKDFRKELDKAEDKFDADLTIDEKCPKCDKKLIIKYGKNGSFIACSGYPDCRFSCNFERDENGKIKLTDEKNGKSTGLKCEKCGSELVIKQSRYGEILACSAYPDCKNIKSFLRLNDGTLKVIEPGEKLEDKCPKCESELVVKSGKNGIFAACSSYPDCNYTANIKVDEDGNLKPQILKIDTVKCEKCDAEMVLKRSRRGSFFACPNYPDCKNTKAAVTNEDGLVTVKQKKAKSNTE
ncbi:type I DNA topoisomerase [Flexistipes sp.]|uniref:type I DNA topoisomerase n=1 Tax=Flexistipes sp. TaxID=3088135 RepID=UPI002E1CC9E9|nr:type I DNA topoisomerase [Flexistipes sp.]